ncbi:amylo-alpha-1,6-glucosidase [Alicyclobacillus sendaiensis]|uniref:Glycogen debranching N-terminal domain-containing protein n=1 Tax=Alicyclobacillus sendaiensis PA2 TaxID=3029425 RepID=A0ABT6XU30_ALISE|nr:glycogen debranching N-terminal domain-containing protein [Alicyclobacillus sendaiensis]MDI9258597.1 glycogen debranching N-terminal domain-containing protein [Alicyclobacillus sendaiensis PA2]
MHGWVIKEDDLFWYGDAEGLSAHGVENVSGHGLYTRDTRVLSTLVWRMDPDVCVTLDAVQASGSESVYRYTNRPPRADDEPPRESLLVERRQRVDGYCFQESGIVRNFGDRAVRLTVIYEVAADFADMFEVRGFQVEAPERAIRTRVSGNVCSFAYASSDGRTWETQVELTGGSTHAGGASPVRWTASDGVGRGELRIHLEPGGRAEWALAVRPRAREGTALPAAGERGTGLSVSENVSSSLCALASAGEGSRSARGAADDAPGPRGWLNGAPVVSGHESFARWYAQGMQDLRMLQSDFGFGPFLVAGVPWYAVPFGRDSLIAARQILSAAPEVARGTLATLAQFQGERLDPTRDEQPGKILHELRDGELARSGKVPFRPYYGSIDATPLFLILLADYWRFTGDRPFLMQMLPHAKRALAWMEDYGDRDGDGFIEYWREAEGGIANQGWKDSGDSMVHADGSLARGPIALAEVQAYAHMAYRAWSEIYGELGDSQEAKRLAKLAEGLASRFLQHFWLEERGEIAMALDGEKRPLGVASSNMGQVLWSDMLPDDVARRVAKRLLQPDLFSGFGIRTLSAKERRYNPMSYHNGSVWPHDTSLVFAGLVKRGAWEEAEQILDGLMRAQAQFPHHRLPELFCGFSREESPRPVPYPVSCSPQAWAAGVPAMVLENLLGLRPDAPRGALILCPRLPASMQALKVRGLRLGSGRLSVEMVRRDGGVHVDVVENTTGLRVDVIDGAKEVMSAG